MTWTGSLDPAQLAQEDECVSHHLMEVHDAFRLVGHPTRTDVVATPR